MTLSGGHGTATLDLRAFTSYEGPQHTVQGANYFSAALDTRMVHILPAWTQATYYRGDQNGTLDWDPDYRLPGCTVPNYERKPDVIGQNSTMTLGLYTVMPFEGYPPYDPNPAFDPCKRYTVTKEIIGGQEPTTAAPHQYAWTSGLSVDTSNPPLAGSLPNQSLSPIDQPPNVKFIAEHPYSTDGKVITGPCDSGRCVAFGLNYTWNDGVQCKANAYLSLHAEDDDEHLYGNIPWYIFDPSGTSSEWTPDDPNPRWTHYADDPKGKVEAFQDWYRAFIDSLEVAIDVACVFVPEGRMLKALDLLGIALPVVFKEPDDLQIPPPSAYGFKIWWQATYGTTITDDQANALLPSFDYLAFRCVWEDCELWYASHYDDNGYVGQSRLKKAKLAATANIWVFQPTHGLP